MSAEPEREPAREADTMRHFYYALAAIAAVILAAFLYIFNYTSFFKLAVPL